MTAGPVSQTESVFREHGPALWRAILLFSGDREIASDAVSEAFAQGLRRGSEVRSLKDWVWRTAFAVARGMLRERSRTSPNLPEPSYEPAPEFELLQMLHDLSERQRAAVVLYYYADYSIRDVAAILGTTSAAVGVHLSRARRRLRNLLEESDD